MIRDSLFRLAWALPLVLLIGGAAMLLMRRFVVPGAPWAKRRTPGRLLLRESLTVSGHTRIHLIEIDGRARLVVESTRQAALHGLADHE